MPAEIVGLGVAVPPYVLTNADLKPYFERVAAIKKEKVDADPSAKISSDVSSSLSNLPVYSAILDALKDFDARVANTTLEQRRTALIVPTGSLTCRRGHCRTCRTWLARMQRAAG